MSRKSKTLVTERAAADSPVAAFPPVLPVASSSRLAWASNPGDADTASEVSML